MILAFIKKLLKIHSPSVGGYMFDYLRSVKNERFTTNKNND